MASRTLQPCGTWAAYLRHYKLGEEPCDPCRTAMRKRAREQYASGATVPKTPLDESKCGTTAGYSAHIKRKLSPCEPCKAARREYNNTRNRARGMAEQKRLPNHCGAPGGYYRHIRDDEPACDACITAKREHATARRRQNGVSPWQPAKCGTRTGYLKHYRSGEVACKPCKAAHAEGSRPRRYWKQLWEEQCGICPLCFGAVPRESDKVQVDHSVPKSKGGSDDISNLQVVHVRCNLIKQALSDAEARTRIAALIESGEY